LTIGVFALISVFLSTGRLYTNDEGSLKFAEFDFWRYKPDAA
jgi:hypothetical protein